MIINHELMESLEYKGEYGGRYRCFECSSFKNGKCALLNDERISVSENNNVCRGFIARIKNPSSPEFNFDDYLEYLMSDYYRPWSVDTSIIIGSACLGEAIADGGKLARLLPKKYSFLYKPYDQPYCRLVNPLTVVRIGKYNFELDYRLYREQKWMIDGSIKYRKVYWKETPTSRKYKVEYNGVFDTKTL